MDKMCTMTWGVGGLEGLYPILHPAGYPLLVAFWGLLMAQSDVVGKSACIAKVFVLHAALVFQAGSEAGVEGHGGGVRRLEGGVFGLVGPVVDLVF